MNLKIIKNSKESDFYKKLGYFENSSLIIRPDVIEKLLSSIRIQRQIEKSNKFILNDQISAQLDLKKG